MSAESAAAAILARYSGDPQPIGVWKPAAGVWERDDEARDASWWPPHQTLGPKKSLLPLRICLLGESTAAGWFYAPAETPAKILEDQLRAVRPGIFEVLDLTKVNLQAAELAELTGASLQLAPDVLVIFAGNNWPVRLPSFPGARRVDCQEAAAALRESGIAGLEAMSRERTRRQAGHVLEVVAHVTAATGTPVVLVVPEVNLADWSRRRPPTWWGEPPSDPRPAVEARAWDNYPTMPSATPTIQDLVREAAARHDLACVDLPATFAALLRGELPGRRFFLDYCHLTLEGMKVAMAAVAAEILSLADPAGHAGMDAQELAVRLPDPQVSARTDALAKFMTALYNAHYDAAGSQVRYWLEAALAAAPDARATMRAYLATRAVPLDALQFSVELRQFYAAVSSLERQSAYQDGVDPELCLMLGDLLGGAPDFAARLAAEDRALDLARPAYHWHILDRYQAGAFANEECAYYRALWPMSEFCLLADGSREVALELTARAPAPGVAVVSVNGAVVREVSLGERWSRTRMTLSPRSGINRVRIRWPHLQTRPEEARAAAIGRLEEGLPADLHPVFGEVFAFRYYQNS